MGTGFIEMLRAQCLVATAEARVFCLAGRTEKALVTLCKGLVTTGHDGTPDSTAVAAGTPGFDSVPGWPRVSSFCSPSCTVPLRPPRVLRQFRGSHLWLLVSTTWGLLDTHVPGAPTDKLIICNFLQVGPRGVKTPQDAPSWTEVTETPADPRFHRDALTLRGTSINGSPRHGARSQSRPG